MPVLLVVLAAVPPAATDAFLLGVDAWSRLSSWLSTASSFDAVERYFVAMWLLVPVHDLFAYVPGLAALLLWRRRSGRSPRSPSERARVRLGFGLAMGLLRERTGSWIPGAGVHVAWNAVAMANSWQLI